MQKKNLIWTLLTLAIVVVFAAHSTAYGADEIDKELKAEIKASIDRGLRFLRDQQEDDGSYMHHPGMTALVASAFMRSPRHYREDDGPFLGNAIKYITGLAKPDGSIYDKDLPNYNTSVALMALVQTKNPDYKDMPIIMLTGVEQRTGIGFKSTAGDPEWLPVDAFHDKPVEPKVLLAEVKRLLSDKP